jgi:hypothetical protein
MTPVGEILLVADVLVGCQEDFKGCFLRGSQEFTVAQCIPTKVFGLFDYAVLEELAERSRSAMVKENKHLAVSWGFPDCARQSPTRP